LVSCLNNYNSDWSMNDLFPAMATACLVQLYKPVGTRERAWVRCGVIYNVPKISKYFSSLTRILHLFSSGHVISTISLFNFLISSWCLCSWPNSKPIWFLLTHFVCSFSYIFNKCLLEKIFKLHRIHTFPVYRYFYYSKI